MVRYWDMSALGNFNVVEPFQWLAGRLLDVPGLTFDDCTPLLRAPTVVVEQARRDWEAQLVAGEKAWV